MLLVRLEIALILLVSHILCWIILAPKIPSLGLRPPSPFECHFESQAKPAFPLLLLSTPPDLVLPKIYAPTLTPYLNLHLHSFFKCMLDSTRDPFRQ